jgi:DNA-binding MarR family transcriptional regulator
MKNKEKPSQKVKTEDKQAQKASGFVPKPLTRGSDVVVEKAWSSDLPHLPSRGIPLFALIDEVASLSQGFHKDTLKPLGYTHTDYAILGTLLLNGSAMKPSFFTRMLDNASAATSQTLKKLESQGLLSRQASEEDKRSVWVVLTEKGKAVAMQLCEAEAEQSHRLTKGLSDQELQDLRFSLSNLISVIK